MISAMTGNPLLSGIEFTFIWLTVNVPRKSRAKYELNTSKDKGLIEVSLQLPWQPSCCSNEVCS